MKLAIDVSQVVYNTGVSDYTRELVTRLPTDGLVKFGFSIRKRHELSGAVNGAKVIPVPPIFTDLVFNQTRILSLEDLVGGVDLYHSSDWIQIRSKAKKVTTIHDMAPFLFPSEHTTDIVAVHSRRMKIVLQECDHFICVSNNTAKDLVRLFGVPKSRISVIYEALPSKFKTKPSEIMESDYLLTMGSNQPRKNVDRLISAFVTHKSRLKLPSKLIIVGMHGDSDTSDVVFKGFVPDSELVGLMKNARAFVYPSIYEGFGLPVLGAFFLRTPVATSNTSCLPEIAGNAASFFDPYDEFSIAMGIKKAIEDKKNLIDLGIRQLKKFSWERTAVDTYNLYETLC